VDQKTREKLESKREEIDALRVDVTARRARLIRAITGKPRRVGLLMRRHVRSQLGEDTLALINATTEYETALMQAST
jgi:hypothetical protein